MANTMFQPLISNSNFSLSSSEETSIDNKIKYELLLKQYLVLKFGVLANFVGATIIVWVFYHIISFQLLFGWYLSLICVDIISIMIAYYFDKHKPQMDQTRPWRNCYRTIVPIICILWGITCILFASIYIQYEFYLLFTLFILVACLGLGNIMDFMASVMSITCLIIPYIVFATYKLILNPTQIGSTVTHYSTMKFQFGIGLVVLGIFIIVLCYIGHNLIVQSLRLSFINETLSKKLESSNKSLEQRVEERTKELRHQATHDAVTGLINQTMLFRLVDTEIKNYKLKKCLFGVAFFSINQMELYINAFGYKVWNDIIKEISTRLYNLVEVQKLFADTKYTIVITRRDEFAIIITPLSSEKEIYKVKALHVAVAKPIHVEGSEIKLNASIGVSIYPENGLDPKTLLKNADAAMLHGRREFAAGENVVFYKPMINANLRRKITLLNSLEAALEKKEFLLLYQPFVNLTTGRICGLEALARWSHPTLGMISPDEFIPLIQITHGLYQFDRWVIHTACTQVNEWNKSGFIDLKIAVNLSETFLKQENIVDIIKNVLNEVHFNPKNLEIELVETISFGETISDNFHKLHELGINFSIDDYGTGQADLGKIRAEQFSKIKIDKAFVKDMMDDERSKLIVLNAIGLARDMKMTILAEGVETEEQLNFLRENGCDMMQGYLFSKPVSAQVFTQLLIEDKKLQLSGEVNSNLKST